MPFLKSSTAAVVATTRVIAGGKNTLPLYHDAEERIKFNLRRIESGDHPSMLAIGFLTETQLHELNLGRSNLDLHLLDQNEIVFIGRHIFNRRSKEGYSIDDIVEQIISALSHSSVVSISRAWSRIDNPIPRADRYGNLVKDRGIFEMTAKKPRAELFSVMPKGDNIRPINIKKPT